MSRFAVVLIAVWIALIGQARNLVAQPGSALWEESRQSLATAADRFPTFDPAYAIYNRAAPGFSRDVWSRLIIANYSSDLLADLLRDARPRVRSLAMGLLYDKQDPKLLMPVARMLSDSAETFPVLQLTDNADPRFTAPQSVGSFAGALLGTYLMAAGMTQWRTPQLVDWMAYDAAHRNRAYSLSWLIVRLGRITRMQSPFPEEQRPRLLEFRKDLDKLPADDRNLYLLWLSNGNRDFDGGSVLATEEEVIDAAGRLGRQKLLQIIDGRPPGTDPDVAAIADWRSLQRYQMVTAFILAHADRLFTRADEPFLGAIEQGIRDKKTRGSQAAQEVVSVEALRRARALLLKEEPKE